MHKVKCKYCGKMFDRDKLPFKQISAARYAHLECAEKEEELIAQKKAEEEALKSKEEKDKEALEGYIKFLLNEKKINPKVRKQLETYINQYNYTYSGIRKALIYFYEIKGNDRDKMNGGIGIVPYCYKQAYDYYYSLWQANLANKDKDISLYVPKERIVIITPPQRKYRKRKIFTFLDEEVEDNE